MISYELERSSIDDDHWMFYASFGSDEDEAIKYWHYWQEKQPNYKFRLQRVTKVVIAMSGNPL